MSTDLASIRCEYDEELDRLQVSMTTMKSIPKPRSLEALQKENPSQHEEPKYQEDDHDDHWRLVRLGEGRGFHLAPKALLPPRDPSITVEDLFDSYTAKGDLWRASETRRKVLARRPGSFDLAICSDLGASFTRSREVSEKALMQLSIFMDLAMHSSKGDTQLVFEQPDYIFTKLDVEFLELLGVNVHAVSRNPEANEANPPLSGSKRMLWFGMLPPAVLQIPRERRPDLMVVPQVLDDTFIKPRREYAESLKDSSEAARALWESLKAVEEWTKHINPLLADTYDSMVLHPVTEKGAEDKAKWFSVYRKKGGEAQSEEEGKLPASGYA